MSPDNFTRMVLSDVTWNGEAIESEVVVEIESDETGILGRRHWRATAVVEFPDYHRGESELAGRTGDGTEWRAEGRGKLDAFDDGTLHRFILRIEGALPEDG